MTFKELYSCNSTGDDSIYAAFNHDDALYQHLEYLRKQTNLGTNYITVTNTNTGESKMYTETLNPTEI